MHWRSFVLWNALGGISWAIGIGLLAYFLGNSAGNAIETFGIYGLVAALVAIASALVLHRRGAPQPGGRSPGLRDTPQRGQEPPPAPEPLRERGAPRSIVAACSAAVRVGAVAGRDALPHVRQHAQLALGEAREEVLAHDRQMRPVLPRAGLARCRSGRRTSLARVLFAGTALQQLLALQAVHQPRQPAARELRLLCEVAHAHSPAARVAQMVQHRITPSEGRSAAAPIQRHQETTRALAGRCSGARAAEHHVEVAPFVCDKRRRELRCGLHGQLEVLGLEVVEALLAIDLPTVASIQRGCGVYKAESTCPCSRICSSDRRSMAPAWPLRRCSAELATGLTMPEAAPRR